MLDFTISEKIPNPNHSIHKAAQLVIVAGTLTPLGIISLLLVYLLLVPCDLSNLGYMYFPSCSNINFHENYVAFPIGSILRVASPCFLAWIILHTFAYCTIYYTIFSSIHCYSLINYIEMFRQFFSSNCKDNYFRCVHMFKRIQVLTHWYNSIH